jgi:hypothetical protein
MRDGEEKRIAREEGGPDKGRERRRRKTRRGEDDVL